MDLSYELSNVEGRQMGMIVLQADETLEKDMRRLLPPDAGLMVSRVPSGTELSNETITEMESHLTGAAALLPRAAQFASVGYGCTSASAQIGSERVAQLIQAGVETPYVTNPAAALIAACRALNVGRLAVISPYVESVSKHLRDTLETAGITVSAFGSFNEPLEENVVRISASSLTGAAIRVAQSGANEAVFLSCTNLRTLDVLEEIEDRTGLPALSSNQCLAWHMMHLARVAPPPGLPGKLWDCAP